MTTCRFCDTAPSDGATISAGCEASVFAPLAAYATAALGGSAPAATIRLDGLEVAVRPDLDAARLRDHALAVVWRAGAEGRLDLGADAGLIRDHLRGAWAIEGARYGLILLVDRGGPAAPAAPAWTDFDETRAIRFGVGAYTLVLLPDWSELGERARLFVARPSMPVMIPILAAAEDIARPPVRAVA